MTPRRLSHNSLKAIQATNNSGRILKAFTSYALTHRERQAIINKVQSLGIKLPETDVVYL